MYVCMCVSIQKYICVHGLCVCTNVHICMCVNTCTCMCMGTCMDVVYVHVHTHIKQEEIYIHTSNKNKYIVVPYVFVLSFQIDFMLIKI